MDFEELISLTGDEPVFESSLLLAGDVDPAAVQRQLSRWVEAGKIYRLTRGLYAPAPPFAKVRPHPFLVANRLVQASYVSLESALAHYGIIPEYVPVTTSITTRRPRSYDTPLGTFSFRHVKTELLWGYQTMQVAPEQEALVAHAEKALLDLIYLRPRADTPSFLRTLRLHTAERLDFDRLDTFAQRTGSPKLRRAAHRLHHLDQELSP